MTSNKQNKLNLGSSQFGYPKDGFKQITSSCEHKALVQVGVYGRTDEDFEEMAKLPCQICIDRMEKDSDGYADIIFKQDELEQKKLARLENRRIIRGEDITENKPSQIKKVEVAMTEEPKTENTISEIVKVESEQEAECKTTQSDSECPLEPEKTEEEYQAELDKREAQLIAAGRLDPIAPAPKVAEEKKAPKAPKAPKVVKEKKVKAPKAEKVAAQKWDRGLIMRNAWKYAKEEATKTGKKNKECFGDGCRKAWAEAKEARKQEIQVAQA